MIYKRYMKWLASFIEKTDGFDNDYYKYNNEGASSYDIENVSNSHCEKSKKSPAPERQFHHKTFPLMPIHHLPR